MMTNQSNSFVMFLLIINNCDKTVMSNNSFLNLMEHFFVLIQAINYKQSRENQQSWWFVFSIISGDNRIIKSKVNWKLVSVIISYMNWRHNLVHARGNNRSWCFWSCSGICLPMINFSHKYFWQLGVLVCVSCIWHPSLMVQYASSQHWCRGSCVSCSELRIKMSIQMLFEVSVACEKAPAQHAGQNIWQYLKG